jgi:hypothetical protein
VCCVLCAVCCALFALLCNGQPALSDDNSDCEVVTVKELGPPYARCSIYVREI